MSVLLHISDPHFGTERPQVVDALVRLSRQQRPDLVVVTGDITQRAKRAQFQAARAFIESLGAASLAIPGNHDIPLFDLAARLLHPYSRHRAVFGDDLEPVHRSNELLVVGVNTTRAYRHKQGEVSRTQIDRVARRLAAATREQLRVVAIHQPIAVTLRKDEKNLLRGHRAARHAWAAAGADLVLGGHIHLPFVIALPEPARPVWAVQAGSAVSSRLRRGVPNSVNIVRWGLEAGERRCRVEQWDFGRADQAFVHTKTTQIRPARG